MRHLLLLSLVATSLLGYGQLPTPGQIAAWAQAQMPATILEHRDFLRLPNDAAYPADMDRNLVWMEAAFEKRGFQVKRLETGRIPLLYAEWGPETAGTTVLFYLHFDGQPVTPPKWEQDHPFKPVLKRQAEDGKWEEIPWSEAEKAFDPNWRIFARSASDDKAPIILLLQAMDILRTHGLEPAFRIKVLLDGEEEKGSQGLKSSLSQHRDQLTADHLVIMDGPVHPSNRPTLALGCRGIATANLTVYGPRQAQHSGHYGNYAPNPAFRLAHLLATMKDESGRVLVPGYYDGIELEAETRTMMAAVPDDETQLQATLGIAAPDSVGQSYQEALQYPSLNIPALGTDYAIGQVRTIVPGFASARLEMRLVPESEGQRLIDLIRTHIEAQGYTVLDSLPTEAQRQTHPKLATYVGQNSVPAFRTPVSAPISQWLIKALGYVHEAEPVIIRTMGGTVPIAPIIDALGIPAVIVPLVNMDNNQHSPNENVRLGNLQAGLQSFLGILLSRP